MDDIEEGKKDPTTTTTRPASDDDFDSKDRTGYVLDDERAEEEVNLERDTTHRALKSRHISMIAIGGAVGTGLIIGSGTALGRSGPVGLLLGYMVVGVVCYFVMVALGEMCAYLPHKHGFPGYSTRFVDPALGFALGWNYLFKYIMATPNNIIAAVICINYWDHKEYSPAIWISLIIGFIFLVNLLGVAVFGEFEFWLSSFKVIVLVGLIILGIVLDLGGGPTHDRIGFRNWKNPGPFASYLFPGTKLGTFMGAWYAFPNALFAYGGTELIAVTVAEAPNPRKQVPKAIRSTFWRILIFYVGGIFVIGLLVPSNSQNLITATKAAANASASPFVVALVEAKIKTLPSILNACILVFVFSAANSDLYIASRTLFALSAEGQAPSIFKKTSKRGIPYFALIFCTCTTGLAYTAVASSALTVFKYFISVLSMLQVITWLTILWTHLSFMRALKAQGVSRSTLPYAAPWQPYGNYFAFGMSFLIMIFKGFDVVVKKFQLIGFITNYVAGVSFLAMWFGYKLLYKTKALKSHEVDLFSGLAEIDEKENEYLAEKAAEGKRSWLNRWWND